MAGKNKKYLYFCYFGGGRTKTKLKNEYIESPKNKQRQLCIPELKMRFISAMLNNALQHVIRPHLPKD